jgi:hypothetical protein
VITHGSKETTQHPESIQGQRARLRENLHGHAPHPESTKARSPQVIAMTSTFFKKIAVIVILLILLIVACAYDFSQPVTPPDLPGKWVAEMRDKS